MVQVSESLERFVLAQAPVYAQAAAELADGRKRSHWMWFVFPQLRGLGRSAMAHTYGIASGAEALAYWRHPLLGARLAECTRLVLDVRGRSAHDIFGSPDDMKFQSCMTLFDAVVADEPMFDAALRHLYGGKRDERTSSLLRG